jgi:hypothetical protein
MPKADNARKRVSAAAALEPTWGRQVSEMRAREAELRLQSARSAHRFHLAAGRLRSTLSAFRPLFAPGVIETLTDDLKWVALPAGVARDAESMRERVNRLSNLEPQELDISLAPMIELPEAAFQESWRDSIDCFDSERYDTFIRALDRFADAPPWLPSAAGRADHVLLPLLREEWTRFRRRGGKAFARDADPLELDRLRAGGDAAGRAHWVCVALEPTFGRKVKQMGKAAERVQVLVDEEREAALTQHLLTDAGEHQLSDGEVGSALKRMRALETRSGVELHQELVKQFHEADRKSLRRWLR